MGILGEMCIVFMRITYKWYACTIKYFFNQTHETRFIWIAFTIQQRVQGCWVWWQPDVHPGTEGWTRWFERSSPFETIHSSNCLGLWLQQSGSPLSHLWSQILFYNQMVLNKDTVQGIKMSSLTCNTGITYCTDRSSLRTTGHRTFQNLVTQNSG